MFGFALGCGKISESCMICADVHLCIHIYAHADTRAYTYTYARTYMYVYNHIRIHENILYINAFTHIRIYACVQVMVIVPSAQEYAYARICAYTRVCAYTHICAFAHICICTFVENDICGARGAEGMRGASDRSQGPHTAHERVSYKRIPSAGRNAVSLEENNSLGAVGSPKVASGISPPRTANFRSPRPTRRGRNGGFP